MYDTGSISFAADLLCQLTNKHNTAQSTQRGIAWYIQEENFFLHQVNIDYGKPQIIEEEDNHEKKL